MTTAQELQRRFHVCMPLSIALGDEMCLSIIEVLTEEALDSRQTSDPTHFEQYGLNVNEIIRWTSLFCPAISHHLKMLKEAGIVGVRQEGMANYYYLALREFNRRLMGLGHRLEEPPYRESVLKLNSAGHTCIRWYFPDILPLSMSGR